MSHMELKVEVECPHCDDIQNEDAPFNLYEAEPERVESRVLRAVCRECNEEFWFRAECRFETEQTESWDKKPKGAD